MLDLWLELSNASTNLAAVVEHRDRDAFRLVSGDGGYPAGPDRRAKSDDSAQSARWRSIFSADSPRTPASIIASQSIISKLISKPYRAAASRADLVGHWMIIEDALLAKI
jgi:hypothetical protein